MEQGKLMLHAGAMKIDRNQLGMIGVPPETDTFKPVSHAYLADYIKGTAQGYFGVPCIKEQYGVSRDGNRMFAVQTFRNLVGDEVGLSIGFRNAHDKSMSLAVAMGFTVFVCDNLALKGEISFMRKHTLNSLSDLKDMTLNCMKKFNPEATVKFIEDLKKTPATNEHAYPIMGHLYGQGIVRIGMLPVIKKEWENPSFDDFKDRNMWSLYNAVTFAMKKSGIEKSMTQLNRMDSFFSEYIL